MTIRRTTFLTTALLLSLTPLARADDFVSRGVQQKDVTFKDIKDGKLIVTLSTGQEVSPLLSDISQISITNLKPFNDAELKRNKPADAAKLYAEALRSAARVQRKVVQARALPALDAAGMYGDAMTNFMELYSASPTPAVWDWHPRNLPADAKSQYLSDAANAITARVNAAPFTREPEAQKNLNTMLLEIYNRQGNLAKAAEVSKILGVDAGPVPEAVAAAPSLSSPAVLVPVTGAGVADVDAALSAQKWDQAIAAADSALAIPRDEATAIKLYLAKATAYRKLSKLDDSAASYLRIATFYPGKTVEASEALFSAAEIQKSLNHDPEAKRLGAELELRYPKSAASLKAERAGLATAPK